MAIPIKERFKNKGSSVKAWAALNSFNYGTAANISLYGWAHIGGDGSKTSQIARAMSKFLGDKDLTATFGKRS